MIARHQHFSIILPTGDAKTYIVSIPTNRQIIAIESLKASLSVGQYRTLTQTQTLSSVVALDLIDMTAVFTTLCPALLADLKQSILDLPADQVNSLLEVYAKQIQPWLYSIEAHIQQASKITSADVDKVLFPTDETTN